MMGILKLRAASHKRKKKCISETAVFKDSYPYLLDPETIC